MRTRLLAAILPLTVCLPASAEWSVTVTGVSDYLFNGVSQTMEDPALQGSIDWAGESGFYAGAWASNVDFGDDTNLEVDVYAGYYQDINDWINLDVGAAHYSYHGASYSDEGDYTEAYMKWGFGNTALNVWYAWDYFGTGAGHYIVMLNQTIPVNDDFSVLLGIDRSTSLDEDEYNWEGDDSYIHWQAMANFTYAGFDIGVGVHGTDLDDAGDTTLLFTLGRTFSF